LFKGLNDKIGTVEKGLQMKICHPVNLACIVIAFFWSAPGYAQDEVPLKCTEQLDALEKALSATGLNPLSNWDKFPPQPWSLKGFPHQQDYQKVMRGTEGHAHTAADLKLMRKHFKTAVELCDAGQDHESMLHMDVVRALHKLPEIQHMTDQK
jgi:hypothetical protein